MMRRPLSGDRAALAAQWRADGFHGDTTVGEELRLSATSGVVVFSSDDADVACDIVDVRRRAESLAIGLRRIGLRPGDVAVIQLPTTFEAMTLTAAVWLAGGVVLPVVDAHGRPELDHILAESRARLIAVPARWRGRTYAAEALGWYSGRVDTIVATGPDPPSGSVPIADLAAAGDPLDAVGRADDLAVVIYTSGTTSAPKGVRHSHNTLLANGFRGATGDAPPRTLGIFPAGHIAGLLATMRPLLLGGTTVIMDRWSPSRAARLVEAHGVVSSAGTPFHLATLLDEAARQGRDIGSLRRFLTGAAPVPPALLDRADRAGIVSWRSYGLTEHPVVSGGAPEHSRRQRHTTDGAVSPGVEVRIVDPARGDLPVGFEGEVVVRGPKQFVGYVDARSDATAFLPGGWFRTGDIGVLDADGHLTITDRRKDVIVRGGENISSKEVEDLLIAHPAVAEVAVCAAPDTVYGEAVCAFAILRPGASLDLAEIERFFRGQGVARFKLPTRLEIRDDLPRTPSGKVRKGDLRDQLRRPSD